MTEIKVVRHTWLGSGRGYESRFNRFAGFHRHQGYDSLDKDPVALHLSSGSIGNVFI